MKLKRLLLTTLLTGVVVFQTVQAAEPDAELLTGDVRLACEAILCLSSGDRSGECAPSINRYFSIHHKKLSDTLRARRNFLSLCPASGEKNMPSLINALANGAGRCDAAELNRMGKRKYTETQCFGKGKNRTCTQVQKTYIANTKPSYCSAYFNHEWTTAGDKVRYIGTEKSGGKWIDFK